MKRNLYILIITLFISVTAFSQSASISGVVIEDANSEKMPLVNVILIDAETKQVVFGTMSDDNGFFKFENLDVSDYNVEISFMGFDKKVIAVNINKSDENIYLSEIRLNQNATALDDIVLVAERPTLTQEGGKTILNVSQALGESPTMEDLMENIPSVQVTEDGGVSIRGQKTVFLIDGVESTAEEFINLSPSIISSVEVQTNASAKYSGSKVINAVLNSKSYQKQMYKGALYYGSYDFMKARFNGFYRNNKWNFAGGAYIQNKNTYKEQSLIRQYDSQEKILNQNKIDTINQYKAKIYSNISYAMDKRNRINIKFDYSTNDDTPMSYLVNNYENSTSDDNLGFNDNDNTKHTFKVLGLWQHKFLDGSKLEVSTKYFTQSSLRVNNAYTEYPNSFRETRKDRYILDERRNYAFLKADYEKSLSENYSIESGLELRVTNNNMDSDVLRYNETTDEWEKNNNKSYNYEYSESKSTAYSSLLYSSESWQFNLGLRLEYIHWVSEVPDSLASKDIFVPSPVIGVVYNLDKNNSFNLSGSRRVEIPSYRNLNPHADLSNPDVIRVGNPSLDPLVTWNFDIGHTFNNGKFMNNLSLFYLYESGKIARVFTQTANENVFLSRPENISGAMSYGIDISQKIKIMKILNISTYFMVYNYVLSGSNLDDRADKEGIMGSVKINTSLKLPLYFRVSIGYNYIGQRIIPNGHIAPESYFNANIFKSFLDNKLQLSFKVSDIFNTRKRTQKVYANGSYSEFSRIFNSQFLMVGASYKFDK